jgi:hypothetical protein
MKKLHQDFLIYGKEYNLFRDGEYIGSAVWTDDENVGDKFIKVLPNGYNLVFEADEWVFKPKEQ